MASLIIPRRFDLTTKYLTTKWLREGCQDEELLERDSQSMLSNEIKDLDALRSYHSTCGIVAIDTEPLVEDTKLVREIGLSFLPPLNTFEGASCPPPKDFRSFLVPTYTISVLGRRCDGNRERLNHGVRRDAHPEDVEDSIIEILDMFISTVSTKPPLILTGFALGREMRVLTQQYPRVLSHFWGWADMQKLCRNILILPTPGSADQFGYGDSTQRLSGLNPRHVNDQIGMRDALIALGYGGDDAAFHQDYLVQHRAGNDTARVIAIFLRLCNQTPDAPKPQVIIKRKYGKRARNKKFLKKALFETRPYPIEEYPFTVRLSRGGAVMPAATVILKIGVFSSFEIKALGIRPPEESPRFCWISFFSIHVLKLFMEHVDSLPPKQVHSQECAHASEGCRCDRSNRARWEAELCLPPETEAWTDQEWEELGHQAQKKTGARLASAEQAAAQTTREERNERRTRLLKEAEKVVDEDYCITWGGDEDEWSGNPSNDPDSDPRNEPTSPKTVGEDDSESVSNEETEESSNGCQSEVDDMEYLLQCIQMLEMDGDQEE